MSVVREIAGVVHQLAAFFSGCRKDEEEKWVPCTKLGRLVQQVNSSRSQQQQQALSPGPGCWISATQNVDQLEGVAQKAQIHMLYGMALCLDEQQRCAAFWL